MRPARWLHAPLILLTLITLGPMLFLVMNSLKADASIKRAPLALPHTLHFGNYVQAWAEAGYSTAFVNTLLIVLGTVVVVTVIAGMAAYSLARLTPTGSGAILVYLLISLTVPASLYLIPLFIAWAHLGLTNTLIGLVIIYSAMYSPFSILLLRSFFVSLPRELEEAGRVDGCGEFGVLVRIVGPISWPAFATLGVILGVWCWNEYLFATTFLTQPSVQTVAVRYASFTASFFSNFAYQAAAGVMMIVPATAIFLVFQRQFIQGVVSGSLSS